MRLSVRWSVIQLGRGDPRLTVDNIQAITGLDTSKKPLKYKP